MSFEISQANISALAVGSGVLACGGGGNPYYAELVARDVLSKTRPVRVLDVEEMEADSVAITSAGVGAPLVGLEKPPSLIALRSGFEAVERSLRVRVGAFVAAEVGGMQSIFPVLLAALNGLPLLDGDGMGRAFPEMQMCTFAIYGTTPTLPLAISDDHGLLWRVPSLPIRSRQHGSGSRSHGNLMGLAMERLLRRYCAYKGGLIYITSTFDKESMVRTLVRGSIGLALKIGG